MAVAEEDEVERIITCCVSKKGWGRV